MPVTKKIKFKGPILKKQALKVLDTFPEEKMLIAEETGITYEWLRALHNGIIADPGVSKVEKLIQWGRENGVKVD